MLRIGRLIRAVKVHRLGPAIMSSDSHAKCMATDLVVCLEDVGKELITQRTQLYRAVVGYVTSERVIIGDGSRGSTTHLGSKKSSLRSRSSPYPNFRKTVQVVSIRPCWMNIVWRYKKPISVIPSPAGDMRGGVG